MKYDGAMDVVLDFDLDYFYHPAISGWEVPREKRLAAKRKAWDEKLSLWRRPQSFRSSLEHLDLSLIERVFRFEKHHQALDLWEFAIREGLLTPPFTVYHFDAHSDLYSFRGEGDRHFQGARKAHEANFLWWAIALGWISEIYWVVPEPAFLWDPWLVDLPRRWCKPRNGQAYWEESRQLFWKGLHPYLLFPQSHRHRSDFSPTRQRLREEMGKIARFRSQLPFLCERFGKKVEVYLVQAEDLPPARPTLASLCRSPDYTPLKADRLFQNFEGWLGI
jgi:hypothetical protein